MQLQLCRILSSSKLTKNSRCFGGSKSKSAPYLPKNVHDKQRCDEQEGGHRQICCLRYCKPPSSPPSFLSHTCQVTREGRRELWVAQGLMSSSTGHMNHPATALLHTLKLSWQRLLGKFAFIDMLIKLLIITRVLPIYHLLNVAN